MKVKTLELINYRNYSHCKISFADGLNILTGQNAQGKTNLLESLVYLSLSRSYRMNEDAKLIQHEKEYGKISAIYEDESEKNIEAILYPHGKTLLYNHQLVKKSSEFIGLLNVILFSPDDLSIFQDAPRERRKLINQEITKISSKYLNSLNRYQNLLKNRNILLKEKQVDLNYLDTITEQMIEEASIIIQKRKQFIDQINELLTNYYQQLASEKANLKIKYLSCIEETANPKQALQELFQNNIQRDLETSVTNVGIHREDIRFELNDVDITEVASQGQKRMILLVFKLALLEYIEKNTNKKAILLLDDVLSELDDEKQRHLIEMIQNVEQFFITATMIPKIIQNQPYTHYYVDNGMITKMKEANDE